LNAKVWDLRGQPSKIILNKFVQVLGDCLCSALYLNLHPQGGCNSVGRPIQDRQKAPSEEEEVHFGRDLNPKSAGYSQKPAF
jgi:hypothetical protein